MLGDPASDFVVGAVAGAVAGARKESALGDPVGDFAVVLAVGATLGDPGSRPSSSCTALASSMRTSRFSSSSGYSRLILVIRTPPGSRVREAFLIFLVVSLPSMFFFPRDMDEVLE